MTRRWFSELLQKIRVRKRALAIVVTLLTLTIGISFSGYESWRLSVQSQIQNQIDLMNTSDPTCSYIISNSFVIPYYEGKVPYFEGGFVNRTQLTDWHAVWFAVTNYASGVLNSNRTRAGCKIWLGLTRTLFVLLGHSRWDFRENDFYITQDLFFARYAPL